MPHQMPPHYIDKNSESFPDVNTHTARFHTKVRQEILYNNTQGLDHKMPPHTVDTFDHNGIQGLDHMMHEWPPPLKYKWHQVTLSKSVKTKTTDDYRFCANITNNNSDQQ